MPQINSVYGQLVGVPVGQTYVAGPGIKIDNVNKTVSVDETVLWSGSLGSTGTSLPLSEATTNFEFIDIYCYPNSNFKTQRAAQVFRFVVPSGSNSAFYYCRTENMEAGTYYSEIIYVNVSSGTSFQLAQGHRWQDNTQTKSIDTYRGEVFKIVGINRIQSA